MNDDRLTATLGAFYENTAQASPDPERSVGQVMTRVRQTRQRGRWWPLPPLHRKARTPTATDTAERQPSPIPATSGHAPTVTGRTRLMFSPVKAITAGALVFAIGGALLIAQPFDQQGSVPGAEQGAEPAPPVRVTSETLGMGECEEQPDGRPANLVCEILKEWSDPRLEGTDVAMRNDSDLALPDDGLQIFSKVHNIETDDGVWRMRPQIRFEFEGSPEVQEGPEWWVLDGDGAYEGLSLLLTSNEGEPLNGYIISTDLVPPAPEGASTK